MTIIASFQRWDGIITLSDTMISRPSSSVVEPTVLPLAGQDFFKSTQETIPGLREYVASGSAQKCVYLGNNCLALWAGSEITARTILREFTKSHQGKARHEAITDLAARIGLDESNLKDISLIVFHDLGDTISQDTLNMRMISNASTDIIYEGTGSYPVIEDINESTSNDNYKEFYTSFLNRMSAAISGEIITQDNHEFNFGGWFEFTKCSQQGFAKIAYAIKLWFVDGDKLSDGPGFVSGYNHYDLLLFSLNRRCKTSTLPVCIPDFLGRKKTALSQWFIPDHKHEFEFHIVYFNDLKRAYFVVLEGSKTAIKMNVSNEGLKWNVNPEFLKSVCNDVRSGGQIIPRLDFSSRPK